MSIVNNDVRLSILVLNNPKAPEAVPDDIFIENGRTDVSMSQKAETKERKGDPFGKEDSSYTGRNSGKGVSHTTYDYVLEQTCMLSER